MPTKEELEVEVKELRLLVYGRPAKASCNNSCPHGMRYHDGPICWGELSVDIQTVCVCPTHPDDPAIPARQVT